MSNNFQKNARSLKIMSVFYLVLVAASLLLIHSSYYEPAVSYVLFYLAASVGVTAFVAMILLPAEQFSDAFSGAMCVLFAAAIAMMTFFSGGLSSELYLLFLPLLMVAALHGSRRIGIPILVVVLFFYTLAIIPGLLNSGADTAGNAPLVFYRLGTLFFVGAFVLFSARPASGEQYSPQADSSERDSDEDGSAKLARRIEGELEQRRGVQVSVVIVDPGGGVDDLDLLLERVRARISDPVLLGEDSVFGFVLTGSNDREIESAARRALAAASSLGANETRAGAATYPRDARSSKELLSAAGRALEAAFEVDSRSAIVISGGNTPREKRYRAAR